MLFILNVNFLCNFLVKLEVVCKISDIFFGGNFRSFVILLIIVVLEVENGDFFYNIVCFYCFNFCVWFGKKWVVFFDLVDCF